MTRTPDVHQQADRTLVEATLGRIASDLGLIVGRKVSARTLQVVRRTEKAVLVSGIAISFRLALRGPLGERHGALLLPLADAASLASFLLGATDDAVRARRATEDLDAELKAGLRELATLLAGAADAAVRELQKDVAITSAGCQGVAPGAKPAFAHRPGHELVIGSFQAQIDGFPASEALAMLPPLEALAAG